MGVAINNSLYVKYSFVYKKKNMQKDNYQSSASIAVNSSVFGSPFESLASDFWWCVVVVTVVVVAP